MIDTKEEQKSIDDKSNVLNNKIDEILNKYYLNNFQKAIVRNFIEKKVGDRDNEKSKRVREWLIREINGTRQPAYSEHQKGCPQIIPGLRAMPWWDTSEFEWVKQIEQNYEVIRDELLSLREQKGF